MQKELVDKANDIIRLIEKNESAIEELSKYAESGKTLYTKAEYPYSVGCCFPQAIDFEDWEIRLMIHQKKQRVQALKVQLERL